MARPNKEGLDYFPFDVDIDQDDKIGMIEALHGLTGFAVVTKLFMKIYKEGYRYEWNKREPILFSKKVNVDINDLNAIIKDCLKEGVFHQEIYEKHSILTSRGIQKRYLEAVKRRKEVSFQKSLFLLDKESISRAVGTSNISIFIVDDDENRVNVNINSIDSNISTQRKVKESKVKESKELNTSSSSPNAFDFYQANIGMIGPKILEEIELWIKDISEPVVVMAMGIAVDKNQRKWSTVKGILGDWFNQGVRTVEEAHASQTEYLNRMRGGNSNGRMDESRGRRQGTSKDPEFTGSNDITKGQTGRIRYEKRD